jgi:hypothetical protein
MPFLSPLPPVQPMSPAYGVPVEIVATAPRPADLGVLPLLSERGLTAAPEAAQTFSGSEMQERIWTQRIVPTAYARLPETTSGGLRGALRSLRTLATAGRTFDHEGDELPPSHQGWKLFHPFGSVLKVSYRSRPGHSYTGLFAEAEVPGLMRLSLARPQASGTFIPGAGLKLFVDGQASANAVFVGQYKGVDGQQPDKDFFAQPFTNLLPKPRLLANRIAAWFIGLFNRGNALQIPVDHFAARSAAGTPVEEPRSPWRLVLKAGPGFSTASDSSSDFRQNLAALPLGTIFEVHAAEGPDSPLVHIGDIEATSQPVASEYGDKSLFFRHSRGRLRRIWASFRRLFGPFSPKAKNRVGV